MQAKVSWPSSLCQQLRPSPADTGSAKSCGNQGNESAATDSGTNLWHRAERGVTGKHHQVPGLCLFRLLGRVICVLPVGVLYALLLRGT
jgi:hypothetical protein